MDFHLTIHSIRTKENPVIRARNIIAGLIQPLQVFSRVRFTGSILLAGFVFFKRHLLCLPETQKVMKIRKEKL